MRSLLVLASCLAMPTTVLGGADAWQCQQLFWAALTTRGLSVICSGPIEACSGNNTCKGGRTGLLCGYCPPGTALELVALTVRTHSHLLSRWLALARTHA